MVFEELILCQIEQMSGMVGSIGHIDKMFCGRKKSTPDKIHAIFDPPIAGCCIRLLSQ